MRQKHHAVKPDFILNYKRPLWKLPYPQGLSRYKLNQNHISRFPSPCCINNLCFYFGRQCTFYIGVMALLAPRPSASRIGVMALLAPRPFASRIGVTGFEPATFRSQSGRSTKLSHTPIKCFR